jgi:hypothetical protein
MLLGSAVARALQSRVQDVCCLLLTAEFALLQWNEQTAQSICIRNCGVSRVELRRQTFSGATDRQLTRISNVDAS